VPAQAFLVYVGHLLERLASTKRTAYFFFLGEAFLALVAVFLAVFFAGDFFGAAGFLAGAVFLAGAAFLAAVFLAAGFLTAVAFFAGDFFAAFLGGMPPKPICRRTQHAGQASQRRAIATTFAQGGAWRQAHLGALWSCASPRAQKKSSNLCFRRRPCGISQLFGTKVFLSLFNLCFARPGPFKSTPRR